MSARLELMDRVVSCTSCELHAQCTAPVFMSGPVPSRIAVLGEAPGEQEDQRGEPFVGPAGKMLRSHLEGAGIDLLSVAYVNTVSCFPHGTPTWDHINACAGNREDQLALTGAEWVLAVGKVATKALNPSLDMKHGRGRPWLQDGRVCMSTYHPAAALRNGNYEQAMQEDIQTFAEMVKAGPKRWLDWIPVSCSGCVKPMYWMQENGLCWCLECVPSPDFERAQKWREAQVAELAAARAG